MVLFNLRKVFSYLVFSFVAVSTFFYLPVPKGMEFMRAVEFGYQVQELLFRYGAMAIIGISYFMEPLRKAKVFPMALFLLASIAVSLLNFDIAARRVILNVFVAVVFYKTISEHLDTRDLKIFSVFASGVIILNIIWCLFQYFGIDPLFSGAGEPGIMDRLVGFMKLKVHLGLLAAFLAPVMAYLSPWLVLLCLPLLFVGFSSSGVLAFVVSIWLLCLFETNFKNRAETFKFVLFNLLFLGLGVYYIVAIDSPSGQFGSRFETWHLTLSYAMKKNIFLGSGLGSFASWEPLTTQLTQTEKLSWLWAHNEYLQTFFEGGLVLLSVIFIYLKGVFDDFKILSVDPIIRFSFVSIISIAIISFFHFPFHLGRFVPVCLVLMAVFNARKCELNG